MDDFDVVDDFLAANYRTGLEEALCDGCLTGRISVVLTDVAAIAATLVHGEREDDGGFYAVYEGTFAVRGIDIVSAAMSSLTAAARASSRMSASFGR